MALNLGERKRLTLSLICRIPDELYAMAFVVESFIEEFWGGLMLQLRYLTEPLDRLCHLEFPL